MSAFEKCITNALKEGNISQEDVNILRGKMKRAREKSGDRILKNNGFTDAEIRAAWEQFEKEVRRRERLQLLSFMRRQQLANVQGKWRDLKDVENPGEFVIQLMESIGPKLQDGARRGNVSTDIISVARLQETIEGEAHALLADLIDQFQPDLVGNTRNKPLARDVVRALFGDPSTPQAKALARAWTQVAENLRQRFNAAGGEIARLENWGLPQSHDHVAIGRVGREDWTAFVRDLIDSARMIDHDTGKPFAPDELTDMLNRTYEAIVSDGWSQRDPTGVNAGASLANRRQEHRFLQFRDADAWLAYQERFGHGDPFGVMMHHVDRMSRDIALLETLGPNPSSTLEFLLQSAEKQMQASGRKMQLGTRLQAEGIYDNYTGHSLAPANEAIARPLQATRASLTSAQLGAAILSAFSDTASGTIARIWAGSRRVNSTLTDIFRYINPADGTHRRLAARTGFIMNNAQGVTLAQARYLGRINQLYGLQSKGGNALDRSYRLANQAAEATLKASGLNMWTRAGRHAFGLEIMGTMADHSGKTLDQLISGDFAEKSFANMIRRYGLGDDWNAIRSAQIFNASDGVTFLRPDDIRAAGHDRLAARVMAMINSEVDFAVPTSSMRAQIIAGGATKPGSIIGEVMRSALMYKSFPTTIIYQTHTRAALLALENGRGWGYGYAAAFLLTMGLFGAGSIQMKELAKGRDLRNMEQKEFWAAAMAQGGGAGIFGDFFLADVNRFGGGLAETIAGPVVGLANDLNRLTIGNVQQALAGKQTNVGRETVNFVRRYTPGSSIWWLRTTWDRLLMDNLQRSLDPDFDDYWKKRTGRQARQFGNGYWWAPGDNAPARAPGIGEPVQLPDRDE